MLVKMLLEPNLIVSLLLNKGNIEDEDDKIDDSMNDVFVAAAHVMRSGTNGNWKKRKEKKQVLKRTKIESSFKGTIRVQDLVKRRAQLEIMRSIRNVAWVIYGCSR
ncbi:hypothetical protein L1887_22770 [Cichorium endivia]|nr:hypothetical protein L1887_22770 [Cichorium endivia]